MPGSGANHQKTPAAHRKEVVSSTEQVKHGVDMNPESFQPLFDREVGDLPRVGTARSRHDVVQTTEAGLCQLD